MAKRRRRGGRPRKDGPRKNGALLRRPPPRDLGPPEILRLRAILNPGQPGLPADPLSALLARGFIDEKGYKAGRYFSALTAIARRGWNLEDGSVAYAYRRLLTGILGEEGPVPTNGHDRTLADQAREKLGAMHSELLRGDRDGAILQTVASICVDGRWEGWCKRILCRIPELAGDWRSLGDLREGLGRLAELGSSRRRDVSPARAEAE
jgi:hypothetical protein